MAERATIARPYAKAAFEYARASNAFAAWSQGLKTAAEIVADSRVVPLTKDPRWQAGDLVWWDNRCAMHRRDAFDPATRRLVHRTQLKGTRPA